ncbi:MAG: TusE/DsrC/DsvC family sulfur relay protein [Deltaproteobacteria bacterium]|nr:TusE/DsrC/DsvC family sulfur relay protein [Deltaproteobacteria bacterium]
MPELQVGDLVLTVDENGFIQEFDLWNETVANALAVSEGVGEMTEEHWRIVRFIREHYRQFGVAPMLRKLTRMTNTKLSRIYELFPSGPAKGACKVAGLPRPDGCV